MVTLANTPAEQAKFYNRSLLARLLPALVFYEYAQKSGIKQNKGKTVSFRKFNSLPVITTALTEGTTPNAQSNSVTEITADIKQYGGHIKYTDVIDKQGIDPYVVETTDVLAEQAAQSIDLTIRNVLMLGTNVHYCGDKTSSDATAATDKITDGDIKKTVRTLRKANAKPCKGGYFVGFINPDVAYDIAQLPLWQDVSKYNGGTNIMKNEIGKLHGVRFIETTQIEGHDNASSVTVHSCIIAGSNAYGVTELDSGAGKPKIIIKEVGSSGTEDPLNQRGAIAWKAEFATIIIDNSAVVRLECAAS